MTRLPFDNQTLPGGASPEPRWWGVYPALVSDNKDPQGQGRVLVRFPWAENADGEPLTLYARLAAPLAGPGYGMFFLPQPGAEVLVAFENGQPEHPVILGGLWNGVDAPPVIESSAQRVLRTSSGVQITFDDHASSPALTLQTPGGLSIQLEDGTHTVQIKDASGNQINLEQGQVTITTSGKLTLNASVVEVAAAQVNLDSSMVRVAGVLQANTVVTNSVISASYTPGAGNIW
jgi:uncharacterized protein involved in type VI secretion and phage assembly